MDFTGKHILIIDGGSRQSLPLIKGLSNLKCKVSVYCSSKLDVGYVYKYTDEKVTGIVNLEDENATYKSMLEVVSKGDYDLVIPTSDFFSTILAKHKEEFSKYSEIYVNDWSVYVQAIDKLKTMTICMNNDIPCPRTAVIDTVDQFNDKEWKYPLVVKPRSSYGAKGFNIVKERRELVTCFKLTEQKFGPSLIQEYIPQTDKQYQVEMLIDKNGDCKFFLLMDKVRWYPLNGGSSTMNITIHDEKVKNACISLLRNLNWRGYASLDLIRDPRDGIIKIMEINPRLNGTAKICYAAGIDLGKLLLQDAFDDIVDDSMSYPDGIGLRYFHMDVLWFLKSSNRFKAKPSWFSNTNTVDEIFDWDDLKPALVYTVVSFKKLLSDKKKRSIGNE